MPNTARFTFRTVRTLTFLLFTFWVGNFIVLGNPALATDALPAGFEIAVPDSSGKEPSASSSKTDESPKTSSEGLTENPTSFQIPILFMTDRTMDRHHNFGNGRMVESSSINDVYCGELLYSLRNDDEKKLSDSISKLGWTSDSKTRKLLHSDLLSSPEQPSDELQEFGNKIVEYANKNASKALILFIPGYNNSFESSAKCAALLAYQTERPVLLYSWPSTAKGNCLNRS